MQQESRTDNLVGDLVGKLISKIENDKTQQTQDYSKEIQPINNSNSNSGNNSVVNIYSDGTKKEDKKPDEKPETKAETIINNFGRSAAEDFGIQTAAGAAGLLGVGALGVAYNSNTASKAKLKLKNIGGGILGAVTTGASAVGTAINNNILKRGPKLGGNKTTTNLIEEEGKIYEKKGKAGKFARLEDEINPLQADFDKHINDPKTQRKITNLDAYMKKNHGHLLKPEVDEAIKKQKQSIELKSTPTSTPTRDVFSPAINLLHLRPKSLFSPTSNYAKPIIDDLKDWNEVNKEANKLQNAFRNFKARNIVKTTRKAKKQTLSPAPMEITNTLQPARLSDVHESTRQGAATTRTFEQNQAIAQLRQQPPTRQSSGTTISNATTLPPQATGGSALKKLKPLTESPAKRGRPKGSGAHKPIKIKYNKPGRPVLQPDPM